MFAQLGEIVFDPLSGFDSYSETDEAVIAVYDLIGSKPMPVAMSGALRVLDIGVRLHQAFIVVKAARIQLRAYKDQGDAVTLSWGTGEVEGSFLIQGLRTDAEVMDDRGNMICCNMSIQLLEVPDGFLYASKQGRSYKKAFAANPKAYPAVVFRKPVPYKEKPWEEYVRYVKLGVKYAGMIEALSYGGVFPYLGSSLGQVMANMSRNLYLMDYNYGLFGSGYDMRDISADLTAARGALSALQAIDPVVNGLAFRGANRTFQRLWRLVCF